MHSDSSSSEDEVQVHTSIDVRELGVNVGDILDTGASCLISTIKEDFVVGNPKKVKIIGVKQGVTTGYKFKCNPNNFGFKEGVFVDKIGGGVRRLVPVPHGMRLEYNPGQGGTLSGDDGSFIGVSSDIPPRVRYKVIVKEESLEDSKGKSCSPNAKPVSAKPVSAFRASKQLQNERLAHILCRKKNCIACALSKSVRKTMKKQRHPKYRSSRALSQLDSDFVGKISPISCRGFSYGLLICCPRTKLFWAIPIRNKSDAVTRIRSVIKTIRTKYANSLADKLICYLRTDNEWVWTEGGLPHMLEEEQILHLKPPPFSPSLNGTIERCVRSLVGSARSMMLGICPSTLWCYCFEYYVLLY